MGHVEITWPAACSLASHSQLVEGGRPHLFMDEWKLLTPVPRRLSLIQDVLGKINPRGLVLAVGMKIQSMDALLEYSSLHL